MVSLYSNWWIKPGLEAEAIPLLKNLAANVLKNEPNTLMYMVHLPKLEFSEKYKAFKSEPLTRPGAVTFVEAYASWDAFNDHVNGIIFKTFVSNHGHLFVQKDSPETKQPNPFIQVVFMDKIAGFVREKV